MHPQPQMCYTPRSVEVRGMYGLLQRLCVLTDQNLRFMRPREVSGVLWSAAALDYPLDEQLMYRVMQV